MIRTYFNHKAAIWDQTCSEQDTAKLEQMAERLNIEPGAMVLDVGSGTGVFLPFLSNKVSQNGQIIALDVAEEMLKKAQAKCLSGKIYYLHASVLNIPLRDETFDVIVCYSSFPHFQNKPKALLEMNRITKGCGRLLICHTSSRTQINEVHRQIPAVKNDSLPDKDEMELMLSTAGFTGIKIEDSSEIYLVSARKPLSQLYLD